MKRIKQIILYFLPLLIFVSCEEVYEPKKLNSDKEILVINGLFTDTDSLVWVRVSYADAFGTETFTGVSDAIVWLIDDAGNRYSFGSGNKYGNYYLNRNFINIDLDQQYYIQVETNNGFIYESAPQGFPGFVTVSEINGEIGEKELSMKNDAGEVIVYTNEGLHLTESLKGSNQNVKYIRFADTAIYQSMYTFLVPYLPIRCVTYHALSSIPVTKSMLIVNGEPQVQNRNVGFVSYINDTDYENSNSTARVTDSWVFVSNALSISKECYNYYNAIINQVSGQDKIFDPAPSQLIGNINCITEPDQLVLGFFEMSRKTTNYVAFHWAQGDEDYKRIDLETYKASGYSHCTDTVPNYDWIIFK